MLDDPKGYYARLGVPSSATAEVLKSAFRQRAKSLHPDNPVSGSEDGFRRLMEAYDVLGDASARARYDDEVRRARREEEARRVKEASGTPRYRQSPHPAGPGFMHMPPMPKARVTWGWMIGLVAACAALAYGAVLLDGGWRALPFGRHSAETPVPPGPPSYYVAAGPDLDFWTQDRQSLMFSFAGRLPQFTSLRAATTPRGDGYVTVVLADGRTGFVHADRLVRGDPAAAIRAACVTNDGAAPHNAELLAPDRIDGRHVLRVRNDGADDAVLELRAPDGLVALALYVVAHQAAQIDHVPSGSFTAEFVAGHGWSRTCHRFLDGQHGGRMDEPVHFDVKWSEHGYATTTLALTIQANPPRPGAASEPVGGALQTN